MDFAFTTEETALRQQIAAFAQKELPPELAGGMTDYEEQYCGRWWETAREIAPKVGSRGWLAPSWPVVYGGAGASFSTQMICMEELAYWGIPGADMGIGGISWIGPSLLAIGSEEQKREHLPHLAAGRRFWCTAYSEPESGSDMASLRTSAVRKGNDYVVNGQKVWTSAGFVADWCWLLVRTDPDVPKHRGLSLLLVDMKSKGITVRPLMAMSGIAPFSEIFFDETHVPAGNLVGEENQGWDYVVSALDHERHDVGIVFAGLTRRMLDEIVGHLRQGGSCGFRQVPPILRHKLANIAVEVEVSRLLAYRAAWLLGTGRASTSESAVSKLASTDLSLRAAQTGMEVLGLYGQLCESSHYAPLKGRVLAAYMSCMGNTILAGTSEIERNVIAQRGLGLPR